METLQLRERQHRCIARVEALLREDPQLPLKVGEQVTYQQQTWTISARASSHLNGETAEVHLVRTPAYWHDEGAGL